ncbi:MAG: non-canonical purine NTP pyrophosphatase, partial [Tannerellaceae bacterium]|nr:non-canonical purine NTP pyrophosphatase [Tannerellaceae bacterium]
MKTLVFATNNLHKLEEIQNIVSGKLQIRSLADIGCREDIPETAGTLEGNALMKARFIKENYGYDCFADDTGLEVEALNNAPGVFS